jgi:hypothetical protein
LRDVLAAAVERWLGAERKTHRLAQLRGDVAL